MDDRTNGKLLTLEIGRGLAALLVLLYHIDKYYFRSDEYWSGSFLGGIFHFGQAGVQYFFVLSGFIMVWSHWQDLGRRDRIGTFALKRFVRIYPLVWATVGTMAAMYYLTQGIGQGIRDVPALFESFLLAGREPLGTVNFPTWTLWHENLFYVFCALMIGWPRAGLAAFGLWSLACLSTMLVTPVSESLPYVIRPINGLFALGVGVAFWLKARRCPAPLVVFCAGLAGFVATGVADNVYGLHLHARIVLFGLSSMLAVIGGVEAERQGKLALPARAGLLGALSYPLYLSHMIVLPIMAKSALYAGATRWLPEWAGGLLMAVVAVMAAFVVHYAFEKPVTRWLRPRLGLARRRDGDGSAAVHA